MKRHVLMLVLIAPALAGAQTPAEEAAPADWAMPARSSQVDGDFPFSVVPDDPRISRISTGLTLPIIWALASDRMPHEVDGPEKEGGSALSIYPIAVVEMGVLFSPDGDEVTLRRTTGSRTRKEDVDASASMFPVGRLGVRFDADPMRVDVTGGLGFFINPWFGGFVALGDVAACFKVNERISLGPHGGPIYFFEPSWFPEDDDGDMNFTSGAFGFQGGLALTADLSKVPGVVPERPAPSLLMSVRVDVIVVDDFDIEGRDRWVPNQDHLDISGLGIFVGLLIQF